MKKDCHVVCHDRFAPTQQLVPLQALASTNFQIHTRFEHADHIRAIDGQTDKIDQHQLTQAKISVVVDGLEVRGVTPPERLFRPHQQPEGLPLRHELLRRREGGTAVFAPGAAAKGEGKHGRFFCRSIGDSIRKYRPRRSFRDRPGEGERGGAVIGLTHAREALGMLCVRIY